MSRSFKALILALARARSHENMIELIKVALEIVLEDVSDPEAVTAQLEEVVKEINDYLVRFNKQDQ